MEPSVTERNLDVSSQLKEAMATPIGIYKALVKIDKKLISLLKSFFKLTEWYKSDCYEYAYKPLFEWFVHPKRIVEDFIYVLGPLLRHVIIDIDTGEREEGDGLWLGEQHRGMSFIGMAALEALARWCPVLEGNWEISLWMIMRLTYPIQFCPKPSTLLSNWIILIIGDADVCPNAHLRIELIKLLELVKMDVQNRAQAFNAMMHACSNLDKEYLSRNDIGYLNCHHTAICHIDCADDFVHDPDDWLDSDSETESVSGDSLNESKARIGNESNYYFCSRIIFGNIVTVFNDIAGDGLFIEFSQKLVEKMNGVQSFRLSSVVHDFSNTCGVNPNKYTIPRELQSLIALLDTLEGYFQEEVQKLDQYEYFYRSCPSRGEGREWKMFYIIAEGLEKCHQIPQLISPIASFLIVAIAFNLEKNAYCYYFDGIDYAWIKETGICYIKYLDNVLQKLNIENGACNKNISPIGLELLSRYGSRLKKLKGLFDQDHFDSYPSINCIMKHVQFEYRPRRRSCGWFDSP